MEEHTTHGMELDFVADGVPRSFQFFKSSENYYRIDIITYWGGFDETPTKTAIILTEAGFNALAEGLWLFRHEQHKWLQPKQDHPNDH